MPLAESVATANSSMPSSTKKGSVALPTMYVRQSVMTMQPCYVNVWPPFIVVQLGHSGADLHPF